MKEYKLRIDSISPLLQSNGAQILLPKAPKQKSAQVFNPTEAAALGVYQTKDKHYAHPTAAFRAAFISAANKYKIGIRSAGGLLAGALEVEPADLVPLADKEGNALTEYTVDVRAIVNHNARNARLPAAKPRWDDWHCFLTLNVDEKVWPADQEDLLFEILDYAGRAIGVGSGRPELRKLSFGKFSITRLD